GPCREKGKTWVFIFSKSTAVFSKKEVLFLSPTTPPAATPPPKSKPPAPFPSEKHPAASRSSFFRSTRRAISCKFKSPTPKNGKSVSTTCRAGKCTGKSFPVVKGLKLKTGLQVLTCCGQFRVGGCIRAGL